MPNWCSNNVTLRHSDKKKMAVLLTEFNKGGENAKFFNVLRKKWGYNVNAHEDQDGNIWISFETAWSPPIALYEYLTKNGWAVEAYYSEPGMQFCGSWIDGIEDHYDYVDILGDKKELEKIPDEIYEFADLKYQHERLLEYQKEQEA
jgi:hypothetical protein